MEKTSRKSGNHRVGGRARAGKCSRHNRRYRQRKLKARFNAKCEAKGKARQMRKRSAAT